VDAPVGGEIDLGALSGPGQPDMGEAGAPPSRGPRGALVERALMREQGLPPSRAGIRCRIPAPWPSAASLMLTACSPSALSRSITSEMLFEKPARFSKSCMERTSSLRFSSRPADRRSGPSATSRCSRSRPARFRPSVCAWNLSWRASARSGHQLAQRQPRLRLISSVATAWRAASVSGCAACGHNRAASAWWRRRGRARDIDDALEGQIVGRLRDHGK